MLNLWKLLTFAVSFCTFWGKGGGGSAAPAPDTKSYSSDLPEYAQPFYEELMKQSAKEVYTTDSAGNVTGGNFALNKVFGPGPATTIRKQFGIDETKDSRSSLYKRIEKFINK